MWVRGLKLNNNSNHVLSPESHPMWVRGLKRAVCCQVSTARWVAPYVGAWIETAYTSRLYLLLMSHPMWVRGLKRWNSYRNPVYRCRTLCGCVD